MYTYYTACILKHFIFCCHPVNRNKHSAVCLQTITVMKCHERCYALSRYDIIDLFQCAGTLLLVRQRPLVSERIRRATQGSSGPADDADDLKFTIPPDLPAWQKPVARFFHQRLHLPDLLLLWIFHIGIHRILCLILFILVAPITARYDLGPVFVLSCIIAAIFTNLGKRREGEASAYSLFNENIQRLPGELDAGVFDQQLRRGQL